MDKPANAEERGNMILGLLELIARTDASINLHKTASDPDILAILQYTELHSRYTDELLELLQDGYGLTLQITSQPNKQAA